MLISIKLEHGRKQIENTAFKENKLTLLWSILQQSFFCVPYLGSLCYIIHHIWVLAGGEVHLTSFSSLPLYCICFHCLHRCNCKNFTLMSAVRAWENPPGKPACFLFILFRKTHQTCRLWESLNTVNGEF